MSEISPRELSARLGEESILVLDVREPWEYALCAIAGSRLVPLQSLPDELGELDPAQTIVTVCHHGMRSHHAAEYLRRNGFRDVLNLSGGIHRWAEELDPAMAQY
jgi:rhodanese-related sulfurtransferase